VQHALAAGDCPVVESVPPEESAHGEPLEASDGPCDDEAVYDLDDMLSDARASADACNLDYGGWEHGREAPRRDHGRNDIAR
jgi:hypothetical protein